MRTYVQILKFMLWLGSAFLVVGLLLKLAHISGSFLISIGLMLLLIQYILSGLLRREHTNNFKETFSYYILWFCSFFILIGYIFKIQHWSGSIILLGIGFVLLALHFLLDFIFTSKKLE